MTFGEKLRKLRKEKGLTQAQLAKLAGLGLKTINNYEKGATYPQNRAVYTTLAGILDCAPNYLHNEGDDFIAAAQSEYGYRGKKSAEKVYRDAVALFAGGELDEEDKDEFMLALQEAFFDAKRRNKKYTPKKYLAEKN